MANEVLLYCDIDEESSEEFITNMNLFSGQDVTVRIASNGGNPDYGYGLIAKTIEKSKESKVTIKVDGMAHSMAAFFLCYFPDCEALDVAQFVIHRAAYPSWFESDEMYFDAQTKSRLQKINADLRAALEAKIDVIKFEKITGFTLDQIFSMDNRIDVTLDSPQAFKVGLINKITTITPTIAATIKSHKISIAAKHSSLNLVEAENKPIINKQKMNITDLKAQHPELVSALIAEGVQKERDRVGAWAAFINVDANFVTEKISTGADMSQKDIAELTVKHFSKAAVAAVENETPVDIIAAESAPVANDDENRIAEIEAATKKLLNLK